jgi:hypothetical protein
MIVVQELAANTAPDRAAKAAGCDSHKKVNAVAQPERNAPACRNALPAFGE